MLLPTEVKMIMKTKLLGTFLFPIFDTVVDFFQDFDYVLCDELRNIKPDIAYLSDIFTKFTEVNFQL